MRRTLTTFATLVYIAVLGVQVHAVSWKTYTDSRQINSLLEYEGEVWAATSGGVLRFTVDGGSLAKYTNSEGLGDNEINTGVAAGGYIWFGSETGKLSRFNPQDGQWRIFLLLDRDGNGIMINDMAVSGEFLWLATDIGISKFDMFRNDGEIKETYRRLGSFTVETPVISICIHDETVIAACDEGIAFANVNDPFLQDYTHWVSATEDASLGYPEADIAVAYAFNSEYMVGTSSGLYTLMETDSLFVWQPVGLSDESIRQLDISNGTLLVTTEAGIYSYDGNTFTPYDLTGLPEVIIRATLSVDGGIVIGTMESGVFVEAAGWQNLQVPGPASNAIVDIGADSKGTIWTVVKEPFASSFDGDTWLHHELPFSEGSQWALQVDRDDGVWIATWQNGALRIHGDSLVKYGRENSSLQGIEVNQSYIVLKDLDIDAFGRIWFPCYLGYPMRPVSFFDPSVEQWDYYTDQEGLEENDIQSIHVAGNDLWTGYENSGLVKTYFGPDPFDHTDVESQRFTTQDFLPSNNIRVLASTVKTGDGDSRDTTIWIGTNAGLARYEYSYGLIFRTELPVGTGPQVNAIEVDSRNNLWIGTSNGLALFFADGSGFEVFTTANSAIAGNEITSLFLDEDNFLWVGTSSGLSRLDYDFGEITVVVEDVIAHPNPFIIPDHTKVFFNYDGEADVSIFTLAGELVTKTSNSEGWDGRNESGQLVASGMYFFYMSTPDGESHTGKIAFIRE
ncbi:MAG: hypothetical protein KAT85_00035 [candidate division Zixibacteria bacterium]|nr:hypothetical protein [candidate division Zixibacteria bacterium]